MTESEVWHKAVEYYLPVLYHGNRGIDSCVNVAMVNKVRLVCGWQTRAGMFQTGNAILTYLKEYDRFIWKKIDPSSSRSTFLQHLSLTVHH